MPPTAQLQLMVVEDSDDDLFLFRRLLTKAAVGNPMMVATNGQAAIDQLATAVAGRDEAQIPRVIFLDLKLPLRSGFEVLTWIRAQPELHRSAVIVLSSSAEARDVKRAYELGAHGYLVKYPAPAVFREVIAVVENAPPDTNADSWSFPGMTRAS